MTALERPLRDLSSPVRATSPAARQLRARTPRRPREFTSTDGLMAAGCAVSSLSACWLVFAYLTDGVAWLGFLTVAYLIYLALFFVVTQERLGRLVAVDRTITMIVATGAIIVLIPLVLLVGYIVVKGAPALRAGFFTHDQKGIRATMPATAGGGSHALVGTLEQVGLALVLSMPLGLLAAVFLNETRSRLRRPVRIFVDAMSGLPSVVAGLFIYAVLILPFAKQTSLFGFNGFMASLALSLTMLPTIARSVEVVLRLVPGGLREASLALGSSKARMVWSVVLPTARTGVATAVILGIARTAGETAPLLFTAFGAYILNANPFSGAQDSLPFYIYQYVREPSSVAIQRGYTGALVLMGVVLALFILARIIGRDRSRKSRRRRRAATTAIPAATAIQETP